MNNYTQLLLLILFNTSLISGIGNQNQILSVINNYTQENNSTPTNPTSTIKEEKTSYIPPQNDYITEVTLPTTVSVSDTKAAITFPTTTLTPPLNNCAQLTKTSRRVVENTESSLNSLMFIAQPIMCAFGLFGNLVSIYLLSHTGVKKSYTVLLCVLTFFDSICLLAFFIYGVTGTSGCKYFSQSDSFYFIFYKTILQVMEMTGAYMSFMVTVFIAVERMVNVIRPLKVLGEGRRRKICFTIFCMFLFVFSWVTCLIVDTYNQNFKIQYIACPGEEVLCQDEIDDSFCAMNSAMFRNIVDRSELGRKIPLTPYVIFGPLPVSITVLACVAIVIKLKSNYRIRSSSSVHRSMQKPTVTVLLICLVYTWCSISVFIIKSPFFDNLHSDCGIEKLRIDVIASEVMNTIGLFNISVNFLIYIASNSIYRQRCAELFLPRKSLQLSIKPTINATTTESKDQQSPHDIVCRRKSLASESSRKSSYKQVITLHYRQDFEIPKRFIDVSCPKKSRSLCEQPIATHK